jgi:hypothetical protein
MASQADGRHEKPHVQHGSTWFNMDWVCAFKKSGPTWTESSGDTDSQWLHGWYFFQSQFGEGRARAQVCRLGIAQGSRSVRKSESPDVG